MGKFVAFGLALFLLAVGVHTIWTRKAGISLGDDNSPVSNEPDFLVTGWIAIVVGCAECAFGLAALRWAIRL